MAANKTRAPRCLTALFNPAETSLRCRMTAAVMAVLMGVLAVTAWQSIAAAHRDAQAMLLRQSSAHMAALKNALTDAVILGDYNAVRERLAGFVAKGDVVEVSFTDAQGARLSATAHPADPDRPDWFARLAGIPTLDATATLTIGGADYGDLRLLLSPHAQEDALWHQALRLGAGFTAGLALIALLIHVLLRINLKGLAALQRAALRFEAGDYGTRIGIDPVQPPELRDAAQAFNHMGNTVAGLFKDLADERNAVDHAAIVSETDLEGTITYVNARFCEISGYSADELIGRNHRIVRSHVHPPEFYARLWETIARGHVWRGEICNRAKRGELYWVATTIVPILGEDGLPRKYLSIRLDITPLKTAQDRLAADRARWETTLASIDDAVLVTDAGNRLEYLNPAAEALLRVPLAEAHRLPVRQLIQLVHRGSNEPVPPFLEGAAPNRSLRGSATLAVASGAEIAISYSCAPLAAGATHGAVYVLRDESEKKQLIDSLRDMAYHDSLTGLPNRRAVEGRLGRALRLAHERGEAQAFCYIDLDHFKLVNDTCGHAVGDALLESLAHSMRAVLPEQAYLGRLGGDEFGLILFGTSTVDALAVCGRLIRAIHEHRFEHQGRRFKLNACAGIAPITAATPAIGDVMIQADMACYRAKAEGSGRMRLYEADEIGFKRLEREMGWAADFDKALESGQFLPYRQLIQATGSDDKSHYEVLIRVRRENGDVEGPGSLLLALERFSQAPILDRWMTERVIEYLARTPEDGAVYFINLSGKTLVDDGFLDTVCTLLDRYAVPGSRIGFEITETAAVHNLEAAQRLILGLRGRGCQFALDDFGQEASSFAYLKSLPADYLKIDGAFVRGMANDRRDQAIIRAVTHLAHDFGMQTVAEQVETAEIAGLLKSMGVNYLQGYHIRRPEPLPGWDAQKRAPGAAAAQAGAYGNTMRK